MIYIVIFVLILIIITGYIVAANNNNEKNISHAITFNDNLSKWEKEYKVKLKMEEERLNNGYYDKYRYLEFNVAGIYYRTNLAKEIILSLDILSDIHFIKEPNNPYDKDAIKIVYDRKRLGYIPSYKSLEVARLIENKQIHKILVIDAGKDITAEYPDALFVTIRVYYTPTEEEIKIEEEAKNKEIERLKIKEKGLATPVIHPLWMDTLLDEIKNLEVESDEQKWIVKKLRENIRNSIKSYDKAIQEEKKVIAENAAKRLTLYKEEIDKLLNKK